MNNVDGLSFYLKGRLDLRFQKECEVFMVFLVGDALTKAAG